MKLRQVRGKWVADYTDQYGRRHRHSFDTKREATAHLVEAKASIQVGTYRPEAAKTSLAVAAEGFIADCRYKEETGELDRATTHNYIGHTDRYVLGRRDLHSSKRPGNRGVYFRGAIGHLRLSEIDNGVLETFRRNLVETGLATGTIRLTFVTLSRIFEWAKDKKQIASNPLKDYRMPRQRRGDAGEVHIPEKRTVAKLIELAEEDFKLHIMFAALTGVRAGEQRAVRWQDIDFDRRRVRIERTANRFKEIGPPKTNAGIRTIPLPSVLLSALRARQETTKFDQPDDLVFPSEDGEVVHHSVWLNGSFYKLWKKFRASPEGRGVKQCKWHALRHYAISTWIEGKAPLKQVQKWAGHSTPALTLNTYTHLFEAADHSHIIDAIEADLFSS